MELKNNGVTADDYERLADAFDRVATSLDEVKAEFTSYRSAARWRAAFGAIALVVIITIVAGMYIVTQSNKDVIDSINDCTKPSGQCFEEAAHRTNERIAPILQMICDATPPERRGPNCR